MAVLTSRREGKYVKAIGTLRVFQGKRNIAANTICLVKDPNQIIFHQLQAISVYNEFSKASVRPLNEVPLRLPCLMSP